MAVHELTSFFEAGGQGLEPKVNFLLPIYFFILFYFHLFINFKIF